MARKKRTAKTITGWASTRSSRGVIRQAESDVQRGLEDTDRRAKPSFPRKRGRK